VEGPHLAVAAPHDDDRRAGRVELLGEVAAGAGQLLEPADVEPRAPEDGVALELVVLGRDVGLDADDIARIAAGPGAAGWTPLDAALVAAADELLADARITDATWAVLAAELDERQLMDVIFTVGAYDALAMLLRSFGVRLDDDLLRE